MTETPTEETPEPAAEPAPGGRLDRRTVVVAAVITALVLAAVAVAIVVLTSSSDDKAPDLSNVAGPSATQAPPSSAAPVSPTQPAAQPSEQPPPPAQPSAAAPAEVGAAKVVADQAVAALNGHDAAAMKKVSCDPAGFDDVTGTPEGAKVEVVGPPQVSADGTATVEVKLTIGDTTTTVPLPLRKQNDTWCVD